MHCFLAAGAWRLCQRRQRARGTPWNVPHCAEQSVQASAASHTRGLSACPLHFCTPHKRSDPSTDLRGFTPTVAPTPPVPHTPRTPTLTPALLTPTQHCKTRSTVVGIRCTDGVVLGVENPFISKMIEPGSASRSYAAARHAGLAVGGVAADGRAVAGRAQAEAVAYKK